ncbi:MAG: hypothetical protein EPN72_08710 [Nevskiaceae bacterium]|nr:MAG: hypothetical protein EPN63_08050 [Nevskiaceae bacterium]TBR72523.1 MAG: hypothetical protein EPN72_08710 [Nevskiaceae bacterium]
MATPVIQPSLATRMARALRRATGFVVAGVLLWVLAVVFLLATPAGLRALCAVAGHATHDALKVEQVSGSVLGGFTATGIAWHGADGTQLTARRVQLAWRPQALLHGSFTLRALVVEALHLRLAAATRPTPQKTPGTTFHLPAGLPLNLRVDAVRLHDFVLVQPNGKSLEVPDALLQATWIGHELNIQRLDVTLPQTGPLHLRAEAVTRAETLAVRNLTVTGPAPDAASVPAPIPAIVTAHGWLGYGATPSDLTITAQAVGWPLVGKDAGTIVAGAGGTLHGQGTLDRYDVDAQLRGTVRGKALTAVLRGSGSPKHLELAKLHLGIDGNGTLDGHGTLKFSAPLVADLDVDLAHFNPAPLAPDFPGDLNGHAQVRTQWLAAGPRIEAVVKVAQSKLRGQPLTVDGAAQAQQTSNVWRVDVERLTASLGATQLTASGRVTPPFNVQGDVRSPDLATLSPELGGYVTASFALRGTQAAPVVVTQGEATGLRFGATRVAQAQWNVKLDVPGTSRVAASAHDIAFGGGERLDTVTLSGAGTLRQHRLEVALTSPQGNAAAALAGAWNLKRQMWQGVVAALDITPKQPAGLAPWHLEGQPALRLAAREQDLAQACLTDGTARLCLGGNRKGTTAQGTFTLQDLQLADLHALLPEAVKLTGRVAGDGTARWHNQRLTASAKLQLAEGVLAVSGAPAVKLLPSEMHIDATPAQVQASARLVTDQGQVTTGATAAAGFGPGFAAAPLTGTLDVDVPDIAFLQSFAAGQIENLTGRVAGALQLSGTPGAPRIAGRVALDGGGLTLPAAGVTLSNLGFALAGDALAPLQVSATAESGGGTVKLDGQIDTTHWPFTARLHLTGSRFQVMDTTDARIWVSPDITLARTPDAVDVQGSLLVPKAELTPHGGFSDNGIAPSEDQVIAGAVPRVQTPLPNITAQLALILGDKVKFSGFGLTTRITGGVLLRQQPHSEALAQGQLFLQDGRYKAYGQDLAIQHGRLIFDGGAVTKPAIDIAAVRQPRADIQVGVQVRGTLDHPTLTLTSTPAMTQQQQLSWLLFGKPLEENSGSDQSAVAAAALSLGLSGGAYVANRIGNRIGIDNISIGTATSGGSAVATNAGTIGASAAAQGYATTAASNAAQLTLGKYLTPRLYISYGVGLFESGQVFRLLYDLGHGFKLQTESGTTNGGDLLYTFQAGH